MAVLWCKPLLKRNGYKTWQKMTSTFCSDCVVKAAKVFRNFWASYLVLSSFGCHFSYISNFTSDFSVCTETATTGGGFKNHKRNCKNSPHIQHTLEKGLKSTCEWKDIYTTRTNKNKDRKYKIIGRTRTARTGMRPTIERFQASSRMGFLFNVSSWRSFRQKHSADYVFPHLAKPTHSRLNRLNRSNLKCDSPTHCTLHTALRFPILECEWLGGSAGIQNKIATPWRCWGSDGLRPRSSQTHGQLWFLLQTLECVLFAGPKNGSKSAKPSCLGPTVQSWFKIGPKLVGTGCLGGRPQLFDMLQREFEMGMNLSR